MSDVFCYKTRGNSSADNKPRVYFTCHPDDLGRYLEEVCKDILDLSNCAVFYTEDMNAPIDDGNTLVTLERMSMFVIPVTYKLLTTPNRTMSFDLNFAKERHIPVLPLLMESGIYEFYKKPGNFGDMQYLKPYGDDTIKIDYKDKLRNYLESVLISDELIQRIRKAFDAYIFLSYRKTDRKYANELMTLIHRNPEFEDIAIWFDEFLTPGESFRESIEKILKDSKLFTLLVTPRLLERQEDGSPNFIMREEYPAARQLGKPILPAEMEKTDEEALKRDYEGIPACSDTSDEEAFKKRLLETLMGIAVSGNNNDPEHNYLIGLAYLKGIDVEVDTGRGVALITRAAKSGLPEAVEKLYLMYKDGDHIKSDGERSLYWANRLYEINLEKYGEEHGETLRVLNNLAVAYYDLKNYEKAAGLHEKCYETSRKILGEMSATTLSVLNNLALDLDALEDHKKAIELLKDCYEIRCRILGETHPDTLNALYNLALAYSSSGADYGRANIMFLKCFVEMQKTLGDEHPSTLRAMNNLAHSFYLEQDFTISAGLHKACYKLRCKVFGNDHPETLISILNLGKVYYSLREFKTALGFRKTGYEIMCRNLTEEHPDTLRSLNDLAMTYYQFGDYKKALELHEKCYETRCRVLGKEHLETLGSMQNIALVYGSLGDYGKAAELYEKCYEVMCNNPGDDAPETINLLNSMAVNYYRLGNINKAIELSEKCYQTRLRILGENHMDTVDSLNNMAVYYYAIGDYKKAVEANSKCYAIKCRILPKYYESTLGSLYRLARSYRALGDNKKALKLAKDCYQRSLEAFGEDHQITKQVYELIKEIRE